MSNKIKVYLQISTLGTYRTRIHMYRGDLIEDHTKMLDLSRLMTQTKHLGVMFL